MPTPPELPVPVPADQRQVDGDIDPFPVYNTHRGKKALSREVGGLPAEATVPDEALRWL